MPKILWMSPYSLHDISSGASIHCRCILESLLPHGVEIWAFSSFVFDRPHGAEYVFGKIDDFYQKYPQANVFEFDDQGIHYIYLKSKNTTEFSRTVSEQNEYFTKYLEVLERFKPDLVISYGTGMDSYTCYAEAKRRGIATVYMLLNGKHGHFTFPNIDLVLTDSQTTAQLYAQRDHINVVAIGQFIKPERVIAHKRSPTYVTMVNPDFSKGLAIVAKLIEYCEKRNHNIKFLIVNSRSNFSQNKVQLYLPSKNNTKSRTYAFKNSSLKNVREVPATHDMREIYQKTKVMLVPSLAYESWGRIISESHLNGIPVLGSNVGGIPEAIGEGGLVIPAPQTCLDDIYCVPTDEEIVPWYQALERLLSEDFSQGITAQNAKLDLAQLSSHLYSILEPYFTQKASQKIELYGLSLAPSN